MKATKRDLIGRRIVAVNFRPFEREDRNTGRNRFVTNPVLTLDNGRRVWFVTQETGGTEYGTQLCISDPVKSAGMTPSEAFERGRQIVKGEA